jgi:UDP-N-acetylmuramate dehydrogenase
VSVDILQHVSLQGRNTLGVEAYAEYLVDITRDTDLPLALDFARRKGLAITVLGGGSNSVFGGNIKGLVICLQTRGIVFTSTGVVVAAGEVWQNLVMSCLDAGYSGLENLTLIPGSVGAAPIQNIGAYGVELSEFVTSVSAVEIATGVTLLLNQEDCRFGYRDSIFKHALKGQVIITRVSLQLARTYTPRLEYLELQRWLENAPAALISPRQVSEAVADIRRLKLPSPQSVGNVGSFFKNPVVAPEQLEQLCQQHPNMPVRLQDSGDGKLSAAWLIDQAGLKELRVGDAMVSKQHALVLVNTGQATGADIIALAEAVRARVLGKFGLTLEIEPVIYS